MKGFLRLNGRAMAAVWALGMMVLTLNAQAGPLRDALKARLEARAEGSASTGDERESDTGLADLGGGSGESCADWSRKVNRLQAWQAKRHPGPQAALTDLAYGRRENETLDVFLPSATGHRPAADGAPIIFMVHGGGWCVGDKANLKVTENKVARWVGRGFVFVSINYPMVADGDDALAQARSVARAAAYVQANARRWGGDPAKLVLMGHSAGAHLISLVNASAALRQSAGMAPALGAVSLDAGALDVVTQMPQVYPFLKARYLEAFGSDEGGWIAASPYHQLDSRAAPWLGVCSTQRKDDPCGQAEAYRAKSLRLGLRAEVLPQNRNHGAINGDLGLAGDYTSAVESFLARLDPALASRLSR